MATPHIIKIDGEGRLRIPKSVRTQMGLTPGTTLKIETADNCELRLRVVSDTPNLIDKEGVLVVQGEPTETVDIRALIERDREERMAYIYSGEQP